MSLVRYVQFLSHLPQDKRKRKTKERKSKLLDHYTNSFTKVSHTTLVSKIYITYSLKQTTLVSKIYRTVWLHFLYSYPISFFYLPCFYNSIAILHNNGILSYWNWKKKKKNQTIKNSVIAHQSSFGINKAKYRSLRIYKKRRR